MKQQWTIATTVFHTIVGDKDLLEAKQAEILDAINTGVRSGMDEVTDINDNQVIANVECVEFHVVDSVVECTTDINDDETEDNN